MRWFRALFILLLAPFAGMAQKSYVIKGEVTDSVTKQQIGFVTVLINAPSTLGTTTNSLGAFEYKSSIPITTATFSFIGYDTKTITINPNADNSHLAVHLLQSQYSLRKVTVVAGENPANRIIRAVIAHRDENDPDRVETYNYTAYNKFIYSGAPPPNSNSKDSTLANLYKFLEDHYFFILENVVQAEFEKPDLRKEKVIGTKMTGIQNPSFTLLNTEMQSFGLYRNFIDIMGNDFINPFCKGSTERYYFTIEDTTYSGKDTIYRLSFRPWKGRRFDGLRGIVEINSDGYAIEHFTAEPADTVTPVMKVKIEQFNEKANGRWFPAKFITDVRYDNLLDNGTQVMMHGTTTLTDIQLNPHLASSDFSGVQVEMLPDAGEKKQDFWDKHRADSLSVREQSTYHYLDSIGKKKHFDAKQRFLEGLIDGELRYKYVNFDMSRFLWLNSIEKERIGVGLRTNDSVFRYVSFGGFIGYSLGSQPTNLYANQRWKYGGNVKFKLYNRNEMYLNFFYWKDFEESGAIRFYREYDEFTTDLLRSFLVNSFDQVKRAQVDFTGRTFRYMHFDVSAFSARKFSTSDYRFLQYQNGEPVLYSQFNYTGFKAAFRFAYKEKMMQAFHETFFLDSYYPVLYGQVTQGFNGLLGGQYTYTKLEAKITYQVSTKAFGDFYFQSTGGYVIGNIPLGDLFAGKGSYEAVGLYDDGTFQTMRLNEFYADKYVAFYYEHDLRTLLFRGKKFQPRPLLVFNSTFGSLSHPQDNLYYNYQTLDKGYYETGLLINDLLTKEYFGVVRIGLGIGAFYRLGFYSFPDPWQNISCKINFDIRY